MSRRDSTVVQRGLGVLTLGIFVLARERLISAAISGSEVGIRMAWMLSAAFALTGTLLLGLLLSMGGAGRSDRIDAETGSSRGRRKR